MMLNFFQLLNVKNSFPVIFGVAKMFMKKWTGRDFLAPTKVGTTNYCICK